MCNVTLDSYFLWLMLQILLLNRYAVINHANICLDLIFLEKTYFMCKSLKKYWNFERILWISIILGMAKKNLIPKLKTLLMIISQYTSSVAMYEHAFVSFISNKEKPLETRKN
jgi:hypothetical protein